VSGLVLNFFGMIWRQNRTQFLSTAKERSNTLHKKCDWS